MRILNQLAFFIEVSEILTIHKPEITSISLLSLALIEKTWQDKLIYEMSFRTIGVGILLY